MNIRIAEETDREEIIRIYNQAVDDRFCTADTEAATVESKREWFEQHHPDAYPIFIAEIDSKTIGWCSLSPYRPGRKALRKVAEISYYLDRDSRGKGLGSRMAQHAIDAAPQFGFKHLFAILLDVNIASVGMLEKFGFQRWGHLPEIADFDGTICGQFIYGRQL